MMNDLIRRQNTLPVGSIEAYISWANRFAVLSADEEYQLATAFQHNGDIEAARRLILSHLRFVVRIARGYLGYGLALADLIQEGSIGLMKAVKRFDPTLGVRLVSFAVYWVKSEIHDFIIKNWRIVKVATTKPQRKLFFNLRKYLTHQKSLTEQDVSWIATELDVPPATIRTMQERLAAYDAQYANDLDNNDDHTPMLTLGDARYAPETYVAQYEHDQQTQHALTNALSTLDERSQHIVQARWLSEKKATLQDLSKRFGISAERIRQIEQAAFAKLKHSLSSAD